MWASFLRGSPSLPADLLARVAAIKGATNYFPNWRGRNKLDQAT
jgi:hypothetical protein